ncbi:AbrB family transcriptional regulator [Thermococcus sp. GR7]|uniref:AbrB/MazE/SpoVT family DNA-binding domain-containing protein n=1 Tax=unclassified Thermococcus TaxID=2627626 RepID=UPI001430CFC9|nr:MULTISPECIES: AbrB/MazE/SpoVT family DNA-binding domain-containing protein [unclassified Thermococcus]NJE47030.1 AbrB family transcriptional regulator [Thermococcus sp. GR7]NJE78145.1 AbrB family transcriptional regulator [Thermococcus sp. GR4]NJF22738.1 AbrB family transcriptional regulator [Thermococcus sp. GR5]
MLAKVDSKGRLYLPKELRKGLPREVYLVRVEEGILIIPKPEDPLKELEELGKDLPDTSIEELRKEILKEAERLAGE